MPSNDQVTEALRAVIDPELRQDIVTLGLIRSLAIHPNGVIDITVSLTIPGCPIRDHFETEVKQALTALDGVIGVNLDFDVLSEEERQDLGRKLGRSSLPAGTLAQVANVIAVGSGKGGVGKSTVTANLAAALAAAGKRVGILDADVWGYSQPRLFGLVGERAKVNADKKILPLRGPGEVDVVSIGFFIDQDAAVIWRGPMLHKALQQFLEDVEWGQLDYLLIDLPPGTGDVSMTIAQLLPDARFLLVTTPQPVAQKVARRSAEMAERLELEIIGVIENMSDFTTPAGEHFAIFGQGGGQDLADELGTPLLASVPLTLPLREQSDAGLPVVVSNPDDPASQAITAAAKHLIAMDSAILPMVSEPTAPVMPAAPKAAGMSLPMA